ncbi:MAG TPA: cupin domain-containing protein [Polyangiaceae bacterium]|nr:cupin domain-containing protein [Polyangiaceae bacterium]
MKTNTLRAGLAVVAGLSFLSVQAPAGDSGKATKDSAVLIPAANVQWSAVPGAAGVQIAAVDGDPSKGPSHFFLKFNSGFAAPLHHHSAEHFVTVVAGTLLLTVDGKEQRLPPGSYFTFAGKKPHMTSCAAGVDCVLSMDVRGKWDVVPEDKATAKK